MKTVRFKSIATGAKLPLAAAALLFLVSIDAHAAGFKVIANKSVTASSVSTSDLKSVYLEDSDSIGGSSVVPVLQKDGPAHEAFLKECVGRNDSSLTLFYRSQAFTGKGSIPKTFGSDAEVVAYVTKTKGAIGYVSVGASTADLKSLQVK
jgi:ABC-type phosphate transport system substrate-binding protein